MKTCESLGRGMCLACERVVAIFLWPDDSISCKSCRKEKK